MSWRTLIMEITGITVPLLYEPPRTGDVRDSLADIRRAQEAFGYAPEYTVRTGLEETIAWYRMTAVIFTGLPFFCAQVCKRNITTYVTSMNSP